nr:MAG TPA: hypothetical protein [Caudoviricetes sp.]
MLPARHVISWKVLPVLSNNYNQSPFLLIII